MFQVSEERKILEMIEKGQITAEDGMKLLEALKDVTPEMEEIQEPVAMTKAIKDYRFLKIHITTDADDTKVNVNIPLKLITAVGGFLPHVSRFIPDNVQDELNEQGINLSNLPIGQLIEAIVSGELDDPTLVDIETNDGDDGLTQVKIYVE